MRDVAIDAVAGGENTEVEAQFLAEIRAACTVNAQRGGDGAAALPQLVGGLSAMEMMGRLGLNSDIDADAASTGAYTGAGVSATLGATASSGTGDDRRNASRFLDRPWYAETRRDAMESSER